MDNIVKFIPFKCIPFIPGGYRFIQAKNLDHKFSNRLDWFFVKEGSKDVYEILKSEDNPYFIVARCTHNDCDIIYLDREYLAVCYDSEHDKFLLIKEDCIPVWWSRRLVRSI